MLLCNLSKCEFGLVTIQFLKRGLQSKRVSKEITTDEKRVNSDKKVVHLL